MKKITILLFLVILPFLAQSQSYKNTVSGSLGIFDDGYGGEITYNVNLNENTFSQLALNVGIDNMVAGTVAVPYSNYSLSYSYFINAIIRNRKKQVLSVGGGAVLGYELVNNGNNDLSNIVSLDGESKIIYGAVATAEIDIIISELYSLVIKTSEFYHVNSDFGKLTNYSAIGIRYYFN